MHPFETIVPERRFQLFVRLLVPTFICMWLLAWSGESLRTLSTQRGVLDYEFAGTPLVVAAILDLWKDSFYALQFNLWFDYVFMVFYASTIAMGVFMARNILNRRDWPLGILARPLAWGQFAAAGLDAIENLGLIAFTFSTASHAYAPIVWWCAAIKFALVGAGIFYVLFAGLVRVFDPD